MQQLLDQIAEDVRNLPVSALQLVGALVSLQDGLPPALNRFVMDQLGQRADLSEVSPAAVAVMRLSAFAAYSDMEFAKLEIITQLEFLKAIAMEDKVLVAAAFMTRLAARLESAFASQTHPNPSCTSAPATVQASSANQFINTHRIL